MEYPSQNRWHCIDIPLMDYQESRDLQIDLISARKKGIIDRDVLILVEHPPVFTIGSRGGLGQLKVSMDFLKEQKIPVIKVERGGDITFHGPGQLVMYPVIDLRLMRLRVSEYTQKLEEIMIRVAEDFGIKAVRNPLNRGVWVGMKKLGSVGIAIRHGIAFHGIALNINLDLKLFSWINPCGLENIRMTSMEQEFSHKITMDDVRDRAKRQTESIFDIRLDPLDISDLKRILK